MGDMFARYNTTNAQLSATYDRMKKGKIDVTPFFQSRLVSLFLTRSDAQNYMIFGDPAVCLRIPDNGSWALYPWRRKDNMASFLDQVISLTLQDPDAARALMEKHSSEITPQLAQEAHNRFLDAAEAQQWGYAIAAASTSSSLYFRLGQRYEGLKTIFIFIKRGI
jgi:hypothetical protein